MSKSRADEIRETIHCLGSRSQNRRNAARARLTLLGARAVAELVEAIEGDVNNAVRARVLPLLALIQDPRGREPLIAMLLDRSPRLREIATRCLGRFPTADVVAALARTMLRDRRSAVRAAAVQSLVEIYAAGEEHALRHVVDLLIDPRQDARLRLSALKVVNLLPATERDGWLARLEADPVPEIRQQVARIIAEARSGQTVDVGQIQLLLDQLGNEDYSDWNGAVVRLAACGARIVRPLVAAMQSRAHDPEYCTRAGIALKALGPRRSRELAEVLPEVDDAVPLQVLVEVIGAQGQRAMIYRLKGLIERVADRELATLKADGFDPMRRVRVKAHVELARIGSRVAIADLRNLLEDPDQRLDLEILTAVELVGKRDELDALLRAFAREDSFVRDRIADVVRAIMKRERIRRNDRRLQALGAARRQALQAILPPASARKRASRPRQTRGPESPD